MSNEMTEKARLFSAAGAQPNLSYLKKAKKRGKSLQVRNELGNTLLLEAAHHNQVEIMEWLIQEGANLNEKNAANETIIILAARHNCQTVLKTFLKEESVINAIDFEKLYKETENKVITLIINNLISFKKLRLLNAQSLTGNKLKSLLASSPRLTKLDLTGCKRLQNKDLSCLQSEPIVSNLKDLTLNNTEFSELELKFNHLNKVEASDCSKLRKVFIITSSIKEIQLQHTPELLELKIISNKDYILDFSHSPELSDERLRKLLSQSHNIKKILLDNCQQVTLIQKNHFQNYKGMLPVSKKSSQKFHLIRTLDILNPSQKKLNWSNQKIIDTDLENYWNNLDLFICTQLNLSRNAISDKGVKILAALLRKNTTIHELDISYNKITNEGIKYLMDALTKNTCLRSLNIANNKLDDSCLDSIHAMLIKNNTLHSIDGGNLFKKKKSPKDEKIKTGYNGKGYLIRDTVKSVVVGDSSVGKTALLMCYTEYRFPTEYNVTTLDNFTTGVEWEGRIFTLHLWDTSGIDEYSRLRSMVYSETDIFLICYSVVSPASFANVKTKWVPEILHHCPSVPYVLVGTKIDLRTDPAVLQLLKKKGKSAISFEQGKEVAKEIGAYAYIECSAREATNVKDLFDKVIEASGSEKKEDTSSLIQEKLAENRKNNLSVTPSTPREKKAISEPESRERSQTLPIISRANAALTYQKIPEKNGHCLYHAVALYLGKDQKKLREEVATYLSEHLTEYENWLLGLLSVGETIEEYLQDVRNGKEWADNIELVVLMRILKRVIVVISPNGSIYNQLDVTSYQDQAPIFVYFNGHNHYDALLLKANCNGSELLQYHLTQRQPFFIEKLPFQQNEKKNKRKNRKKKIVNSIELKTTTTTSTVIDLQKTPDVTASEKKVGNPFSETSDFKALDDTAKSDVEQETLGEKKNNDHKTPGSLVMVNNKEEATRYLPQELALSKKPLPANTADITREHEKQLAQNYTPLERNTPPTQTPLPQQQPATISLPSLKKGDKLAEGQFGAVFKGTWQKSASQALPVAIKQLKSAQPNEQEQAAFLKEANLLAGLQCEYIVTFYGMVQEQSFFLLVMELCAGGSLYAKLHSQATISSEQQLKWGGQIITGVAYLHDRQVIHHDLATRNVLLTADGTAKITDFGLSKTKTYYANGQTAKSSVAVTGDLSFAWSAPEMLDGALKASPIQASYETDIYSLGITLWEIVSREAPLEKAGANPMLKMAAVVNGYKDPIPNNAPNPYPEMIKACRERDPKNRPTAKRLQQQYGNLMIFGGTRQTTQNQPTIQTTQQMGFSSGQRSGQ